MDPRLFEPGRSQGVSLQRIGMTVQQSAVAMNTSSSELANALTLPTPTSYYPRQETVHIPEADQPQPQPLPTLPAPEPSGSRSSPISDALPVHATASAMNDSGVPPRFCSVKGCKTVIPGSYEYKMCPSCRTRYRGYGTTKRRKWKTQRQLLDHKLDDLRDDEDQKRREQGLPVCLFVLCFIIRNGKSIFGAVRGTVSRWFERIGCETTRSLIWARRFCCRCGIVGLTPRPSTLPLYQEFRSPCV
ncbi:hypothetical protein FA15DRAFT_463351 [Coprinopsis marcescibilis]|uniref:Uncharacterized protein n=1 Tax=Coprinopsis marcescibilis TaxID=230819 RepID=A0A5C3KSP0_COPMA|nr:hypothetical protein FA15DRAFT_463351 [Coprinopsis marcescibilis]